MLNTLGVKAVIDWLGIKKEKSFLAKSNSKKLHEYPNMQYKQGKNTYGVVGDCGVVAIVNAMNYVMKRKKYTEQYMIKRIIKMGEAHIEGKEMSISEARTYQVIISEISRERILAIIFGNVDTNNIIDMTKEDSSCVIIDVYSSCLFNLKEEGKRDHAIVVLKPYTISKEVKGFDIVDSGGGTSYVTIEQFNEMFYARYKNEPRIIVKVESKPMRVAENRHYNRQYRSEVVD